MKEMRMEKTDMEETTEKCDKISVIVPCYNEEESLGHFYERTTLVLTQMDADYELLFVDDGSSDKTLSILREMTERDSHCRYLSFSRNFGKEAAMYAGLREADGDYRVFMDADLQHPPELLPKMYQAVSQEGYDCCGGKRVGRDGDGVLRSFCSRMFYKVCRALTHMDMGDGYGDFRMMNRTMAEAILEMKEYNRYMKGIFSFVGFRTKWISFENVERESGESKWNFKSLLGYAAEGILSFSTMPLKLAGIFGAVLLAAGLDSFYILSESEMAVITTFGSPASVTTSGLKLKLPFIQKVYKMSKEIKGMPIGYELDPMDSSRSEVLTESLTFAFTGLERTTEL